MEVVLPQPNSGIPAVGRVNPVEQIWATRISQRIDEIIDKMDAIIDRMDGMVDRMNEKLDRMGRSTGNCAAGIINVE